MAIPGPGPAISISTLNTEFGGGYAMSSYYRGGTYVPNSPQNAAIPTSGAISLSNFYGSSNRMIYSLTASGNNYDVYANRGASYQAGKSDITVTVPGTVGSANTSSYALLVPSSFSPGDTITLINNGLIQGAGGTGGHGGSPNNPAGTPSVNLPQAGFVGGNAIYVNRPVTIYNNNTIAGGGGGGGGGGGNQVTISKVLTFPGGGGGGGGAGTVGGGGGAGGAGYTFPGGPAPSGLPGSAGTSPAGGAGGTGGSLAGSGGVGGGRGAAGSAGISSVQTGAAGGGAGNYIVGNAFVTWAAVGTRQGGAS